MKRIGIFLAMLFVALGLVVPVNVKAEDIIIADADEYENYQFTKPIVFGEPFPDTAVVSLKEYNRHDNPNNKRIFFTGEMPVYWYTRDKDWKYHRVGKNETVKEGTDYCVSIMDSLENDPDTFEEITDPEYPISTTYKTTGQRLYVGSYGMVYVRKNYSSVSVDSSLSFYRMKVTDGTGYINNETDPADDVVSWNYLHEWDYDIRGFVDKEAVITIKADEIPGKTFYGWKVLEGDVKLADPTAKTTTFKMPKMGVKIKALYTQNSGSQTENPSTGETVQVTKPGTVTNDTVAGAEALYTKPSGTATTVTIPTTMTIDGITYRITGIAPGAFQNHPTLKSVTIPAGIQSIGADTFSGCKKLKTVTIGGDVVTIESGAFKNCTALKSITIPKKVTTIGANAFSGCKNLKTVTIKSAKLKSVGRNAFKGIKANATIKVPRKKYTAYKNKLTAKTGFKKKTMKLKKQ